MFNQQILLIISIALIGFTAAYKSYKNYSVYLAHAYDESDLKLLHDLELNFIGIDFWDRIHRVTNSSYRIMVEPEVKNKFLNVLSANHIQNHIIIDDLENGMVESNFRAGRRNLSKTFDFEHFWDYEEVNAYLDHLDKNYARYTTISIIGKSGENRAIRSIHIKGEQRKVKPRTIIVDAAIHAREWIAPMTAVYLIHELVENRQNNLELLLNIDWVIVPIVNPDGYVYTHEYDRFWRKTRSINPKTKCVGVDPNRNFDFHWDTPGASSLNECSESYRGPKPNSLPEVAHLSKLILKYRFAIFYLTLHSYGGYLLYPYGYDGSEVENSEEHQRLGVIISDKISKGVEAYY